MSVPFPALVIALLASAAAAISPAGPPAPSAPLSECATELTPAGAARALELQRAGAYTPPAARPRDLCRIPLTMHVVRRTNGTGGLEQNWVDECIGDADSFYAPIGMSFFQAGPTLFIDSDALYEIGNEFETELLRRTQVVPGTINIYFVNNATYCGISSFTFSPFQGIVINNNCTPRGNNHSTFSHEIGHYFDLFHTHEPAYGVECPSGSNCLLAGDLICDTPADPGLSGVVGADCVYTGTATPPCGGSVPYAPNTRNLMSYSRAGCRDHFTPGQYDRILATLINLRPEFNCGPTCPGDWNGDGAINSSDISAFLTSWLASVTGPNLDADFNADGVTNSSDISSFLTAWLEGVLVSC